VVVERRVMIFMVAATCCTSAVCASQRRLCTSAGVMESILAKAGPRIPRTVVAVRASTPSSPSYDKSASPQALSRSPQALAYKLVGSRTLGGL